MKNQKGRKHKEEKGRQRNMMVRGLLDCEDEMNKEREKNILEAYKKR